MNNPPLDRVTDDVLEAYRAFVKRMYGVVPNRVLMNHEFAARFKTEVLTQALYQMQDIYGPLHYHGMRLVEDENTVGVEVAYAR